jgi:hypothetical protein
MGGDSNDWAEYFKLRQPRTKATYRGRVPGAASCRHVYVQHAHSFNAEIDILDISVDHNTISILKDLMKEELSGATYVEDEFIARWFPNMEPQTDEALVSYVQQAGLSHNLPISPIRSLKGSNHGPLTSPSRSTTNLSRGSSIPFSPWQRHTTTNYKDTRVLSVPDRSITLCNSTPTISL